MTTATKSKIEDLRKKYGNNLDQINGRIQELTTEQGAVLEKAGETLDFTKVGDLLKGATTLEKVDSFKQATLELADLGTLADEARELHKGADAVRNAAEYLKQPKGSATHPTGAGRYSAAAKQAEWDNIPLLGDAFVESKAFTERRSNGGSSGGPENIGEKYFAGDILTKTTMETTAGWAPENLRSGRVVDIATRPVQILDIIPVGNTSQNSVVYMEETTFTNAAAERAETAAAAEATLELTQRSSPVQSIAVWLPVTREQLDDVPQVRGYVNRRLPFMVRQRLDLQVLSGNGTAPNLSGILDQGSLQTQARGSDSNVDAIYKAGVKVRVTGRAMPNAVIMHPNNWQTIRLAQTTDGIYIYAHPSDPGPQRLFGWQVVESDAITANLGLIGDYATYCELSMRQGIAVELSTEHSDFFLKLQVAVLAHLRAAFTVYRPTAFCSITSLN